ncbi:hypothetical protein EVJ33_14990 [Exiguobacterium sp. SL-10]|uniref:hypothetical protein n=1 Tax=Exiguobacterium sp. SL-10 TaxID=2510962 RepID=UPI00103ACF3A|nr:hypothetical protein [Exiguobacterium sp. SL-10]TCI28149.1 hypothetical protein EVJ33_14990 [Exiguobacterium sp. SL-10]
MSSATYSLFYLQEASRLTISGQPFQAYGLLQRNGLEDSDLGHVLQRTLPDYESAMAMIDEFQHHLSNDLSKAHLISKKLPELIYPESLQMQRLAVSVLEDDEKMVEHLLQQLPIKHPFRTQVESLLTAPVEKRKESAAILPVAAALLLSIGAGYWIYQEGQGDVLSMASQVEKAQAEGAASTLEIEKLKQELKDKEDAIQSLETKYEQELAALVAEEEASLDDGGLSGFTAYSEGRYEEAVKLLDNMEPIGLYNQETIDFYKLMAEYKTSAQSRDILNQFESQYPTSDYLGDAYFSYYVASGKQNGFSAQLAAEIQSRFANHWFINAL